MSRAVRSTTDTSLVGTRKLMPVILPFRSGMTSPTALAAPVVEGMMLPRTLRPVRQSRPARASTAFCLAVAAWMVLISACLMPKVSWMTLVMGARQFVVQEALDTTSISVV